MAKRSALGLTSTPGILSGDPSGKTAIIPDPFDGIRIDGSETKVLSGDGTGTTLYFSANYFSFDNLIGL